MFKCFTSLVLTLLISACTVKLIAPANPMMVSSLESIQRQINTILETNLEEPKSTAASYQTFLSDYITIRVTMDDLVANAKAIENDSSTTAQLLKLQASLKELEDLHKRGFKSANEIAILEATLNQEFSSIYALQDIKQAYADNNGGHNV